MKPPFHLNLQSKIIATFLALALIPLIFHSVWNARKSSQSLVHSASQVLSRTAEKSAHDLDLLLLNILKDIEISSQLHELADFLYLAPDQRDDNKSEAAVMTIIRTLHRGAHPYGVSYALLDKDGMNLLDTSTYDIGSNESGEIYYQEAVQTKKPYISPVIFHKSYAQKASIYFSTPVFGVTGEILGILRARFSAAILQDFTHQLGGLGGVDSFAMLLDSNNIVFGHSSTPSLIYKILSNGDKSSLPDLQHKGLLPNIPLEDLCVEVAGLDLPFLSNQKPEIVVTRLTPDSELIYQTAISSVAIFDLWVVLAQPQEVFLGPIAEQINTTIYLVIITVLLVTIVGIFVSYQLVKPTIKLTKLARRIAEGDLSVEAQIDCRDERDQLAEAFNSMASQLRNLIGGLQNEIMERKHIEAELRTSEDRYRRLFMDSPISLWEEDFSEVKLFLDSLRNEGITDFKTYFIENPEVVEQCAQMVKILDVNTATMKLLEAKDKNQIQHTPGMFFSDEAMDVFREELTVLANGEDWYENEAVQRTINGEKKNVVIQLSVAPGYKESLARVLVSFVDITEHKQAQKEVFQLRERLLQSQKLEALGTLAGGIAHDFNNMLGGIMGAAELLTTLQPKNAQAERYHKIIIDSAVRAAGLTEQLLTFSHRNHKTSTPVDVHEIIHATLLLAGNTLDKRIDLKISLTAERSIIVGDPSQLQNAFLNLCINSAHAMPDGGEISICSKILELDEIFCKMSSFDLEPGQFLEIELRDTGKGIEAQYLPKIFDPFFTTKMQGEGTGLGLASVYGTINQHNGAISVYSEIDVGTSFHILLPLTSASAVVSQDVQLVAKGRGRVLVVDDEEVMRLTAKAILEELSYEVILAKNGKQAVEIFQEDRRIDLVLLDMIMPVMSGRDCFYKLQEIDPKVQVVLSSGFTKEEDLKELQLIGLKGFIRKPYRSVNLGQVINDFMCSRSD